MLDSAGPEETASGGWEGESRSHHPCKEEPLRLLCREREREREKGEKARKVNRCPRPPPRGWFPRGWMAGGVTSRSQ